MDENSTPELSKWQILGAVILPIVCLAPFLGKAFHIDDTVYLYVAQQIQQHPLQFYSFPINWHNQPMWVFFFNRNPPLLPFYLGTLAFAVGWSEVAMHLVHLVPTVFASVGILYLANRLCRRPFLAVCIAVLTPAFVVSNSVIMCEPFMLAFYVWAIFFWIRGMDTESPKFLAASGICIALGILSKYVVISAVPLLLAYTLVRERKASRTLYYLLIPCGIFAVYELYGIVQYSVSLLRGATNMGSGEKEPLSALLLVSKSLYGLSFTGGIFISAFFLMPMLHGWRMFAGLVVAFCSIVAIIVLPESASWSAWARSEDTIQWAFVLQLALFSMTGIYIFVLAVRDLWIERNSDSLLLFLLIMGIFTFGGFVNWSVTARSVFPMLPAVAILVARQIDRADWSVMRSRLVAVPLLLSAVVAMAVGYGDYAYAGSARTAVEQIYDEPDRLSGRVWFQGHWGFQYYMEERGATHINWTFLANEPVAMPVEGDTIVWWRGQYDTFPYQVHMKSERLIEVEQPGFVSVMSFGNGAGFYWSKMGPLPYYFGSSHPEQFTVYEVGSEPYRAYQRPPED